MPRFARFVLASAIAAGMGYAFLSAAHIELPIVENGWRIQMNARAVAWLAVACAAYSTALLFGVIRWRILLKAQGLQIPFLRLLQAWLIGEFLGSILFRQIARDVFRLSDTALYTSRTAEPLAVLLVERVCGLVSFTFLLALCVPLIRRVVTVDPQWLVAVTGVYLLLMAVGLSLVLHPAWSPFLAAMVPLPEAARPFVHRFALALAAYNAHKRTLLLAILAALARQLAACLTLSALVMMFREPAGDAINALHAGPGFLFGPQLAPFLGGGGTSRLILDNLTGTAAGWTRQGFDIAVLLSTAAFPFALGAAALFARALTRTDSRGNSRLADGPARSSLLSDIDVARYRRVLVDTTVGGLLGGLVAGGFVGLCEALWLAHGMVNPPELQILWWGPLAYGLMLSGCGLGIACATALVYALFRQKPRPMGGMVAAAFGGTVAASLLIIGRWRYVRDVLYGQEVDLSENLVILVVALGIGLLLERALAFLAARVRLSKRSGSALALAVFGCLVLTGAFLLPATPGRASRDALTSPPRGGGPNVVLVVIDALRADYLRLYADSAEAKTPNLDALAADSVLFRNAFAQAPWTKPSFATIFTSLYPSEHGAVAKGAPLPQECVTLAEGLAERGYHTKGFANNRNIVPTDGFGQGFVEYDYLEPDLIFGARPSSSELALYEVLRRVHTRLLSSEIDVENFYAPGERVNRAVFDWMDQSEPPAGAPLFLFVHYMDPHDPYMDSEEPGVGYAMIELGFNPDAEHYLEPMRRAYIDEIEHVDRCVGDLLNALRARGLYDDAIILVTADHGEELYDHQGWWHGETLFDEQLRVPFIVKLPRSEQGGTMRDDFARLLDVAPTMLDLAGAEVPSTMRGRPLFEAGQDAKGPALVFAERHYGDFVLRCARSREVKLITARPGEEPKYFDLHSDPQERNDRFGGMAEHRDSLTKQMERFQRSAAP